MLLASSSYCALTYFFHARNSSVMKRMCIIVFTVSFLFTARLVWAGPVENIMSTRYGLYRGIAPSVKSAVGVGEATYEIRSDGVKFRFADGDSIQTLDLPPIDDKSFSTPEIETQLLRQTFPTAENISVIKGEKILLIFVNGKSTFGKNAPMLIIYNDWPANPNNQTVLFAPDGYQLFHHDAALEAAALASKKPGREIGRAHV